MLLALLVYPHYNSLECCVSIISSPDTQAGLEQKQLAGANSIHHFCTADRLRKGRPILDVWKKVGRLLNRVNNVATSKVGMMAVLAADTVKINQMRNGGVGGGNYFSCLALRGGVLIKV